jgi:site-specific DNA-methyltransferase (adenine-specific)
MWELAVQDRLYFGDNLTILREYIADESVDLVYLDPPFNSQAHYNVLFKSPLSDAVSAQAEAFRDTWSWGVEAESAHFEIMQTGGGVARFVDALRTALGDSDMMAYLVMMAVRLQALKHKLKPSGSLFLHCDPTASHYLKILLDGIMGPDGFRNEIIWQRSTAKGHTTRRLSTNHDVILFYAGKDATWNQNAVYLPYDLNNLPEKIDKKYTQSDPDGRRYQLDNLLNPNKNRPNLEYEFKGVTRVWRWTRERMMKADKEGRIVQTAPGRVPRFKRYLDEQPGMPLTDVWNDIGPLNSQARERLGYPTQKPLSLLKRIVLAASNEGDVVLDPFCGCGTTVEAAASTNRHWLGIDVAIHAIKVIEARMAERLAIKNIQIEGIPRDFESAARLAERDKYQFQWWANYLFNPHALREQKKGPDQGIDGEMFFPNGPGRPWGRMLTSVKGGANIGPSMVRDFRGVLERESAEMGLFICLGQPTAAMVREAAAAGFAQTVHGKIPRLQIVSIQEYFDGKRPVTPPTAHLSTTSFQRALKRTASSALPDPNQPEFAFSFSGGKTEADVVHFNPGMVTSNDAADKTG